MPLQIRGGLEADRSTITPDARELIVTTDENKLYIGDGSTLGGLPVAAGFTSPLTSKGDLHVYSSDDARLAIGSNGQVLTADSSVASGMKWATPAAGGGAVSPLSDDLDAANFSITDALLDGHRTVGYDLAADLDGLVSAGTATLSKSHNFYYYADLTSALEIVFPNGSAADGPVGVITISLAAGGSVTLGAGQTVAYEKLDPLDNDPTIFSTENDVFRIYYNYDPVVAGYVVNITSLGVVTPPAPTGVTLVASAKSSLSNVNKDVHSYDYNYTSVTQDGGVYVYVAFITDSLSSKPLDATAYDAQLTEVGVTSTTDSCAIWVGYYKPTQGDLDAGTLSLTFNYTNEVAQFVVVEMAGVNASVPTDDFVTTAGVGTSIGPVPIDASNNNTMLLSFMLGDTDGGLITITPSALNSFIELFTLNSPTQGAPSFSVHYRILAAAAFDVDSPTYNVSASEELRLIGLSVQP